MGLMPFPDLREWGRALTLPPWVMAEACLSDLGEGGRRSETEGAETSEELRTASGVLGIVKMGETGASKTSAETVRMVGMEIENRTMEEVEMERGYGTDFKIRIGSERGVENMNRTEFLGEERMATSADTENEGAGAGVHHECEIESETTNDRVIDTVIGGITIEIVTNGGGGANMGSWNFRNGSISKHCMFHDMALSACACPYTTSFKPALFRAI